MRLLQHLTALIIFIASSQAWSNPEEDRQLFLDTFAGNIPDVPISQYIYGSMMLSEDALDQYESIMDFPPFQEMVDQGKKIWETPFKNGQKFANCFGNKGTK